MNSTSQNSIDTLQTISLYEKSGVSYGGLLEGIGPTADELSILNLGYRFVSQVIMTLRA